MPLSPASNWPKFFEDDLTKQRAVTFFTTEPVPLPVVEWLLAEAARRL